MGLLTMYKENFVSVMESLENDLFDKFPDVFDNGLCKLPGKVHMQVDLAQLSTSDSPSEESTGIC